jgi:hypothetical protein
MKQKRVNPSIAIEPATRYDRKTIFRLYNC